MLPPVQGSRKPKSTKSISRHSRLRRFSLYDPLEIPGELLNFQNCQAGADAEGEQRHACRGCAGVGAVRRVAVLDGRDDALRGRTVVPDLRRARAVLPEDRARHSKPAGQTTVSVLLVFFSFLSTRSLSSLKEEGEEVW